MMGKWLLVVCFQVLLWVPTQSTETSELCDSDDGSAYLQSNLKASSALQVAGGANASKRRTDCANSTEFNAGVCDSSQTDECTGCTDGGDIPGLSTLTGFPDGSFLCLNDQDGSGKVCQNSGSTYTFKNSSDFMTCRGYQSCVGSWFVENVGAVCCSVASESGESCKNIAKFTMTTDANSICTHDACCDGYQTCDDSEFKGLNSLSCRAENACDATTFELAKNLYCNTDSLVSTKEVSSSCKGSTFTITAGGQHCLQCLGVDVCVDSTFDFDVASEVSVHCVGKTACSGNTKFNLQGGSTLSMNCDGEDSCKGSNVKVTLGDNSEMLLTCKGSAACNSMVIDKGTNSKCKCTDSNGGDCPSGCSANEVVNVPSVCAADQADSACCSGNGPDAAAGGHPDCSQCCTGHGGGGGDPHIDTFDGQHYLLLKQGSFSFWHFSGLDAEVMSAKWLKKLPVDFKMYAHYSGHLSYTKGILLLDSSGLQQPRQMLELTSEDCLWRASQPGMGANASWRTIEKPQLLSVPDKDGDEFTAFKFSESSKGQKMRLKMLMKQRDGAWKSVGTLLVRCKPGYHINMKMAMSKKDMDRIDGQIASHGHTSAGDDHALPTASFLHFMNQRVRTDQEFLTPKSWTDLGGSKQAAEYLGDVDEEGPAFLKGCSESEKLEADKTCKKYLGQPPVGAALQGFENSLRNCVFDVCNGGGEVAAELAAEILYAE